MSTDIAWAAGLFEGEGSSVATTTNGRAYLVLSLSMHPRDRDVLERLQRILGGNLHGPYKNGMCRWSLSGSRAVEFARARNDFVEQLGARRRSRLAECPALVESQPPPVSPQVSGRRAGIASGIARRKAAALRAVA